MSWITPYHEYNDFPYPLSFDDAVLIFEEQVGGWLLDIADNCINGQIECMRHSGFAAIMLAFGYFEMIAKYKAGYVKDLTSKAGLSRHHFNEGVKDVFGTTFASWSQQAIDDALTILYRSVRCGFYHSGMAHARVAIDASYPTLGYDHAQKFVQMNPHKLVPELKAHVSEYVRKLRQRPELTELRTNFLKRFNAVHQYDPLQD